MLSGTAMFPLTRAHFDSTKVHPIGSPVVNQNIGTEEFVHGSEFNDKGLESECRFTMMKCVASTFKKKPPRQKFWTQLVHPAKPWLLCTWEKTQTNSN